MQVQLKQNTDARPFFSRGTGQIGIYIDFYDVVPSNTQDYGSQQYMLMDFIDKLHEELSQIPLEKIKGIFERRQLLSGTIFEKWHKGVVLAVSFDSQADLEQMWKDYEDLKVEPVLKKYLNTPELLKAIGATKIQLRARMWRDEYDACKAEFDLKRMRPFSLKDKEYDQRMMRNVRAYQKNELGEIVRVLREDYAQMDSTFSQLTMVLRKSIPIKVTKIINFKEFESYYGQIKATKKKQLKPFEDYVFMRGRILEVIEKLEDNIVHPLAQVHAQCETESQHNIKLKMREECEHMKDRLQTEFDWSHLKHPEWVNKILHRDYGLFLGLVSVVGAGMDTLAEIDIQCDEYLSGVNGVKI